MKFVLLCLLVPFLSTAQILLSDDFSDGDFSQNLTWQGDDSLYQVNTHDELQLNANSAGQAQLTTKSKVSLNASWEFSLKMDFNPSSSNYAKIYLMSHSKDLTRGVQGYFIRVGGSSSDKLSLFRQDGLSKSLICESRADYLDQSQVQLRVKVIRDSLHQWTLLADTGVFRNPFQVLAAGLDSNYMVSHYFGINCIYTKTRAKLFSFDDFQWTGDSLIDLSPPRIDTVFQIYKNVIQMSFNEEVRKIDAENILNYTLLDSANSILIAELDSLDKSQVKLIFDKELNPKGQYALNISGIGDLAGNTMLIQYSFDLNHISPFIENLEVVSPFNLKLFFTGKLLMNTSFGIYKILLNNDIKMDSIWILEMNGVTELHISLQKNLSDSLNYQLLINGIPDHFGYEIFDTINFSSYKAQKGDLIINELMPDPSPVVGIYPNLLPEAEYLELYNKSAYYLNLKNWSLRIGSKRVILSHYILKPNGYILLTANESLNEFPDSITKMSVGISSSALLNSGTTIQLESPEGIINSQVSYTLDWYKNPNKEGGGWSLERIDANVECEGFENWSAAVNSIGGSPGFENNNYGLFTDSIPPVFQSVALLGDSLLQIETSEELDEALITEKSNYQISPRLNIETIEYQESKINITFVEALDLDTLYSLKLIQKPADCNGNKLTRDSILFALPSYPENGDIIINEILFNAKPGHSDFIEIYNRSNKTFDLSKLGLGNWNSELNGLENFDLLSSQGSLFTPRSYKVFTRNKASLKESYNIKYPWNLMEINDMVSLDDRQGDVAIASSRFEIIDRLYYHSDWHSALLNNTEGVSLERVSFAENRNESGNWHSASSNSGYATPGYRNSQNFDPQLKLDIQIEPKVFSPNLDGYHDLVSISYKFDKTGGVVSIKICNSGGNVVKVLLNNELISQEGIAFWDGQDHSGRALPVGAYIVLVDYFHEEIGARQFKGVCILSR